jgi:hypothetical protein
MTRRRLLTRTLTATGLLMGAMGLISGCGGGGSNGGNQVKFTPEQQEEINKQQAASEAYGKEQMAKQKQK